MRILEDDEWDSSMSVEGFTPAKPDEHAEPFMNQTSPNYFSTLGVPSLPGGILIVTTTATSNMALRFLTGLPLRL